MNNSRYILKEPLSLRLYTPVKPTGFKYREIKEGGSFSTDNKDYNHILFLLEGMMKISCNEFVHEQINEKQFFLIPIAADLSCKALCDCQIIIFTFDDAFSQSERSYLQNLYNLSSGSVSHFTLLPFCEPLDIFLKPFLLFYRKRVDKSVLHEIKQMELMIILQSFYSEQEIASFFHPLIGKSTHFRTQIMRNYRKISHVDELASVMGLEKRTFGRQFKDEFGLSPYQWLLNQKAKHVRFSLAESRQPLDVIRQEHGFKFAGHFTRFCKEQFQCTPIKLRRMLAYSK